MSNFAIGVATELETDIIWGDIDIEKIAREGRPYFSNDLNRSLTNFKNSRIEKYFNTPGMRPELAFYDLQEAIMEICGRLERKFTSYLFNVVELDDMFFLVAKRR